jgi:hypothetical protein
MQAVGQAGQGSVVSFKPAFTLEASLLCVPRATSGPNKLCGLWAGQILTPESPPPQFVHLGVANV